MGGDVWAWAAAGPIFGFMALLQPRSVKSMALDTTEPQRGLDYTELDPPPPCLSLTEALRRECYTSAVQHDRAELVLRARVS